MTSPAAGQPAQDAAVEPMPDAACELFGERLALARRYADLLCDEGVLRGLIGPREPGRIWSRHLINSAALADFVPADANVVDVGSGAGLPGIPLALARPDLRMTLVEPQSRRMRFLELVRKQLGLDLTLQQARAEDAPGGADVVVARAVAPLGRLLELAVPLLRPGGMLLAHKGSGAATELADAGPVLARLAAADVSVNALDPADENSNVVRIVLGPEAIPLPGGGRSHAQGARRQRQRRGTK